MTKPTHLSERRCVPCVHYNQVGVTPWTHSVGGLSESDFILAAKVDAIGDGA